MTNLLRGKRKNCLFGIRKGEGEKLELKTRKIKIKIKNIRKVKVMLKKTPALANSGDDKWIDF